MTTIIYPSEEPRAPAAPAPAPSVTPRQLDLALKFESGFHAAIEQARACGVGYIRIKHVSTIHDGENFEVDVPLSENVIVKTPTL